MGCSKRWDPSDDHSAAPSSRSRAGTGSNFAAADHPLRASRAATDRPRPADAGDRPTHATRRSPTNDRRPSDLVRRSFRLHAANPRVCCDSAVISVRVRVRVRVWVWVWASAWVRAGEDPRHRSSPMQGRSTHSVPSAPSGTSSGRSSRQRRPTPTPIHERLPPRNEKRLDRGKPHVEPFRGSVLMEGKVVDSIGQGKTRLAVLGGLWTSVFRSR